MLEETKDSKKKSLGRGLEALLGEMDENILEDELSQVNNNSNKANIDTIHESPLQPRKEFDEEAIKALAESIKEKGILQPLIVRSDNNGGYELIAGERRLRAARQAGLTEIPIIIKELDDKEVLEIALVENLLRENLSPIEEADAYQKLIDSFDHTQEKIADIVGKSRSYIANTLRLLSLPDAVKKYINDGKLTAGHARCLVGLDNAEKLADKIIKDGLNVRQVETLVSNQKDKKSDNDKIIKKAAPKDKDILAIENSLKSKLGLRIKISQNSQGGGKVVMQYASLAELDMIVNILDKQKSLNISLPEASTTEHQDEVSNNEKFSIKFID